MPFKNKKKENNFSKDLKQDLSDASGPLVDPLHCSVKPQAWLSKKKTLLRKGNRKERLRYAKLYKDWIENLRQLMNTNLKF